MWARMHELDRLVDHYLSVGFDQEDDLVTTPAEFDALMNGWVIRSAAATRTDLDAVNKAVLAGTAAPPLPNPSLQRAGVLLGAMVALWPVVGRHQAKTATEPGKVAPNTHLIFGEMHALAGLDLKTRLDAILAEASDDDDVPVTLTAEQIAALGGFLAANLPDAGDALREVLGSLDDDGVTPDP
jgi:hypothetical protein